jgi:hypothetical protein
MKVLFLDIDGVMNSRQYIKRVDVDFDDPKHQMDPDAVIRLNSICSQTGASIVVTSTWRKAFTYYLDKLQDCIASYGIKAPVIGMTADLVLDGYSRTDEILCWLADHVDIDGYVVLDDEGINLPGHLVQTKFDDGIQDHHVRMAVVILGEVSYVPTQTDT